MRFIFSLLFITGCATVDPCLCERGAWFPGSKECAEVMYFRNPCTMQYDPVCGCDGNTYGNPCEAHQHGVKRFTDGECKE